MWELSFVIPRNHALDFKFLLKLKYINTPCFVEVEEGPSRLLIGEQALQEDARLALFRLDNDEVLEYHVFVEASKVSPFDLAASWRAYQEHFPLTLGFQTCGEKQLLLPHPEKNAMPVLGQIRRWLMQPNVWRFLSFLSTVIGLVCYARSSPFNHLFKKWNFFKLFFYIVISFIICLIVLFAKVWQRLRCHLVKAHLTVMIFTGSSVYSFFFEKALKGKPDAYSLVSCAAFAIMSLSLSRQTHCGIEVDLLYYFLGCLFALLAKIHLLLAIFVGGGFAYCLTLLRYSLDGDAQPEDGDLELGRVGDSQQANTGSPLHTIPQQANTDSAPLMTFDAQPQNEYLELQDHGVTQVDSHSQPDDNGSAFNISEFRAMVMAENKQYIMGLTRQNQTVKEMLFEHVADYLSTNVVRLLTDPNLVIDVLGSEIVNKLHRTVELMVYSGVKEEECCQMYINWRREFLAKFLSFIMMVQFDNEDVDDIEIIQRWIKASDIAVQILFPNERTLCDRVFSGFSSIADLSFTEVCRELTICLLYFANNIAIKKRFSSNNLRSIVRMFERLRDFIPELQSVFPDQCSVWLRNEAIMIWKKFGEAIRGIFMELKNQIRDDSVQAAVPGGVHPVTHKVMKCLTDVVFEAKDTLEHIFKEYPVVADRKGTSPSLSVQLAWIIELLETNLEAKSKNYTDPALGYVFMMNNGSYIQHKANDSELGTILGDDWVRKHTAKVQQHLQHYQRSSWDNVLGFLKLDDNGSVAPNVATESMKEKLKLFNMHFKEICSVQSTWFVIDEQLREEIRVSLDKIITLAYRNFIGRFRKVLSKHADDYIEYGMVDIAALLNDLFRGSN